MFVEFMPIIRATKQPSFLQKRHFIVHLTIIGLPKTNKQTNEKTTPNQNNNYKNIDDNNNNNNKYNNNNYNNNN